MRRIKWVAAIVVCVSVLLSGCGVKNAESVVKGLDKATKSMESYRGSGTMILHTGQQPLEYQVEVWYKKPEYYRIALTNAKKDITQIVLRNDDGVFVLTPSLNKSFRFQSDWPQNQGQVYLYQTLVQSILLDNSRKFTTDKDAYVFDVMANYQNGSLARQKIWLDKKSYAPLHVEVSDSNANVMVEVKFDKFEFGSKFDDKAFDMQANMGSPSSPNPPADKPDDTKKPDANKDGKTSENAADGTADNGASSPDQAAAAAPDDGTAQTGSGEQPGDSSAAAQTFTAMEPSYLPDGVALQDVNDVVFGGNKGVMMRYSGDYSYTLIQTQPQDRAVALVPGIMLDLGKTVGLLTGDDQKTLTWTYQGIEYRLTSGDLPETEMIQVAQSVEAEMNK